MGGTRQGLVRMSLVLGMAASIWAVAGSPSGASTRWSEHDVSRAHAPRASSSRHHASRHRFNLVRTGIHRPTLHLSWMTPKNQAVVSGKLKESAHNCVVSATSGAGVDHVVFYRDGALLNTERSAPYSCIWTTTTAVEGSSHTLKAVARDELGGTASASVRVTVHNADTRPPGTRITSGPSGTIGTPSASFSFTSSEAGSSFECRLDGGAWAGCSSPTPYSGLADGSHGFEVRATDGATNTDATPASRSFTVDTSSPSGDGYPSLTSFDHDGDFDSGCQLVGGGGGWDSNVSGSDHPGTASIVSSPVEEGNCAVKYSTPAGTGSGRAELAFGSLGPDPTLVYEELLYIPSEANNGPDHGSLTQTKMSNNPCYNGGLTLPKDGGGNLGYSIVGSCSADSRKFDLGSVPKNQWIAVKAAEKFGSLGSVQVWIDPDGTGPAGYVEKLSQPNIDTTPVAGAQVKMRQGLYHDQDAHESHIYGDGFHMDCTASC